MFTSAIWRSTAFLATTVTVASLGLAACAGGQSGATTSAAAASASAGGTVTLVTYDSYAISKKTLNEFTRQTGMDVAVIKGGDAAEVVNRALLTKGNPEGDLLFGVDNNLMSRAIDNGLFQPYQATASDQVPQQYRLDTSGTLTPIDHGDVCVNFDTAWFKQKGLAVPRTLDDLKKPEYRDLLVVENPATSTPGLAFLLATVAKYGPDGYTSYWQGLKDNGVQVENSWDSAYERRFSGAGGAGDRPLVVSYATSPAAEVVFADKPPPDGKAPTGVMLDTCYQQVEFAGVLANAANPAGAQRFIDFMLTRTYQEDLPLNDFVFPILPTAQLPKVFVDNVQTAEHPLSVPADQVDANREAWVRTWTDTVQR